jgi:hypothetical protein
VKQEWGYDEDEKCPYCMCIFLRSCNQTILAVTNETVEEWNSKIQALNTNQLHVLKSHDVFADVDDPKGILEKNLTPIILNEFNNPGTAPPHELHLKVSYMYETFYVQKLLLTLKMI